MKRSYKKQRFRLLLLLNSVLLAVCIITASAYVYITYNRTKDRLTDKAIIDASQLFDNFSGESWIFDCSDDYIKCYINNLNSSDKYIEIKGSYNNTIAKSENVFADYFVANEKSTDIDIYESSSKKYIRVEDFAYIDFDNFRNSMTDEQYAKITEYLQSKPNEDDMYYELVCKEYYSSKKPYDEIKPKTVEIVKTSDVNDWYVQDTPVEAFELNPKITADLTLKKITDMNRNVIGTDFVLNKYNYDNIKNTTKQMEAKNVNLMQTDNFTYTYMETNTSNYPSIENEYEYNYACTMYACQFNVLEECIDDIIFVSLIILFFFIIIGAILEFAIIHTFNSRVRQEQKLIEMTNAFAHNMKTPIQVITGFTENLNRHTENESNKHYIDVIQNQAFSMDTLVHRMLDYSRLDSNEIKMSKSSFALDDLLNDILKKYSGYTKTKVEVTSDASAVIINADRTLLQLAIENLIENAVKYSPQNSVVNIRITKGRFEISNACENIMQNDIKKLWQPYFRLGSGGEKGNGIGLSIVSSVLKLHKFKYGAFVSDDVITFYFRF